MLGFGLGDAENANTFFFHREFSAENVHHHRHCFLFHHQPIYYLLLRTKRMVAVAPADGNKWHGLI